MNFRNDYWTVTSGAGYIIDDKTNLYTDFSFYCANDHFKNAAVAVPYGLGATQYTASASHHSPIDQANAPAVKIGYFNYRDSTYGGTIIMKRIDLFRSSVPLLIGNSDASDRA